MSEISSSTRVREQMHLSDAVYDVIDQKLSTGEARHRLMLRDCLGTLAVALEGSHGHKFASDIAHKRLLDHLASGGLLTSDPVFAPYERYQTFAAELQGVRPGLRLAPDPALAQVFTAYGDEERATVDRDSHPETDSRHVIHVTALAVPYALREYYKWLDPSLVSSYSFFHDILEWHTGDVQTLNLSNRDHEKKIHDEHEALTLFANSFGHTNPKLVALIEDYEGLKDDEAKFVKTFDKLDPGFTHFADNGSVIRKLGVDTPTRFWQVHHATSRRMSRYALGFSHVLEDRDTRAELIEQITWPEYFDIT